MSKAHFPHWRYVALHLEGTPVSRRALQSAIGKAARTQGVPDDDLPHLTRFQWPHAIVRVHHHQLDAARTWLPAITAVHQEGRSVALRVQTLSTSGTIKALTDRLGVLKQR